MFARTDAFIISIVFRKSMKGIYERCVLCQEIIDAVEQMSGLSQKLIKLGVLEGISAKMASSTAQAEAEFDALKDYIIQEDLHRDEADAVMLAKAFQSNQKNVAMGIGNPYTLAEFTENRRKWIAIQQEKGLWRANLVKTEEVKTEEVK